jgi:hypothetical protein
MGFEGKGKFEGLKGMSADVREVSVPTMFRELPQ